MVSSQLEFVSQCLDTYVACVLALTAVDSNQTFSSLFLEVARNRVLKLQYVITVLMVDSTLLSVCFSKTSADQIGYLYLCTDHVVCVCCV